MFRECFTPLRFYGDLIKVFELSKHLCSYNWRQATDFANQTAMAMALFWLLKNARRNRCDRLLNALFFPKLLVESCLGKLGKASLQLT